MPPLFAGVIDRSTGLLSCLSLSLECYRSRLMSTATQTELYTKEMKKRKKREADWRYRQNKQKAAHKIENKLAMTITENESLKHTVEELRQEIFHLTSQRQLIEQRFETIYTELEQEIECVCAAGEGFGEQMEWEFPAAIPSCHSIF